MKISREKSKQTNKQFTTGKERNKENCDGGEIFNCQYPLTKQEHCAPVEEEECERWQKNNDCNDSK